MQDILVTEDHAVTRRGIVEIVRETYPSARIGQAADAEEFRSLFSVGSWDLVLLDVMIPGSNVIELLKYARQNDSTVPILILTAVTELEYVHQTMQAGANGLIHKHRAADDLVEAIRVVSAGGSYLHPETAAAVAASLRSEESPPHETLSPREFEVFCKIALGAAIKEVAAELGLSDKTVATHLARIRKKTGLHSPVEIARYALHHRLVD